MVELNRTVVGAVAAGAATLAAVLGVAAVGRTDASGPSTSPAAAVLPVAATTPAPTATGNGKGNGKGNANGMGHGHGWGPGGPGMGRGLGLGHLGADLSSLAGRLGVSESALRDAVKGARDDLRAAQPTPTAPPTGPPTAAQQKAATDAFTAALAKRLGMDVTTVRAAVAAEQAARQADRQKAFDARLAQAVKDGKLTQAEADAVKKAAAAGVIDMDDGPH